MLAPWKKRYDTPRQHIKKQRHHLADKCQYSQSYGFSISHIWMWELDHKEGWVSDSCSVMPDSLQTCELRPARLLCPWNSPGKITGVGCYSLLQGIFLTQGSNLVSSIAGRSFTVWATWEALHLLLSTMYMLAVAFEVEMAWTFLSALTSLLDLGSTVF